MSLSPSDAERALLRRLSAVQVEVSRAARLRLAQYVELLAKWNRHVNLTSLPLDPLGDAAIDRLIVEPVIAAEHIREPQAAWMDFGSGGGSPAIPLKIVQPGLRLTLVEAASRKAAFLREAVRALGLAGARVDARRFEVVASEAEARGSVRLVTVRAVRGDEPLFVAAHRVLDPSGRLWLFTSTSRPPETSLFRTDEVSMLTAGNYLLVLKPVVGSRGTGER